MARRPELFVRELSDGEAAHLLKLARRSRNPTVQHRAMLLPVARSAAADRRQGATRPCLCRCRRLFN